MIIGERLQNTMDYRHWSQSELARRVGVDRAHIHYILKGTKSPSLDMAIKIARALGVSLDYLVGLEPSSKSK